MVKVAVRDPLTLTLAWQVDIEGSEWNTFLGPKRTGRGSGVWHMCNGEALGQLQIDHLNIELHVGGSDGAGVTPETLSRFFRGADECGLRLFYREPMWFQLPGCAEFAFVHSRKVAQIYRTLHLAEQAGDKKGGATLAG